MINGIACFRRKRRKREVITPPGTTISGVENSGGTKEAEENQGNGDVEMGKITEKRQRPSTAFSIFTANEDAENQETWKEIARALDRIFFWLFVIMITVSSIAIYSQAGRLTSADTF